MTSIIQRIILDLARNGLPPVDQRDYNPQGKMRGERGGRFDPIQPGTAHYNINKSRKTLLTAFQRHARKNGTSGGVSEALDYLMKESNTPEEINHIAQASKTKLGKDLGPVESPPKVKSEPKIRANPPVKKTEPLKKPSQPSDSTTPNPKLNSDSMHNKSTLFISDALVNVMKELLNKEGIIKYDDRKLDEHKLVAIERCKTLGLLIGKMGSDLHSYEAILSDDGKEAIKSPNSKIIVDRMRREETINNSHIRKREIPANILEAIKYIHETNPSYAKLRNESPYGYLLSSLSDEWGLLGTPEVRHEKLYPDMGPEYEKYVGDVSYPTLTQEGLEILKSSGKHRSTFKSSPIHMKIEDATPDESKYTEGENTALIYYKSTKYGAINMSLIGGKFNHPTDVDIVAHMDNIMDKSYLVDPCVIYNGCATDVSKILLSGGYGVGDFFQLDTYTSTSLDEEVSKGFTNVIQDKAGNPVRVMLKINQPANSHCYYYGKNDEEAEILLPRNTQLKIKSISNIDSKGDKSDRIVMIECDRV